MGHDVTLERGPGRPPRVAALSSAGADGRVERRARVAELVDAPDLGSGAFGREGSSPFSRTTAVIRALVERPVADEAGRDGCAGRSVVASDPDHGAPGGSFGSAPRTRSTVSA